MPRLFVVLLRFVGRLLGLGSKPWDEPTEVWDRPGKTWDETDLTD